MNHIAQYRNVIHHQIHHNPCPPLPNFTSRFSTPNLGPLPDNVMIQQIISDGTVPYHNGSMQQFITGTENRQPPQNGNDKVSTNHRKQNMVRSFQPGQSIISNPTPSCSTGQESAPKGPDSLICTNDISYKTPQNTTVENHQFMQHCDQGAKNCVQSYNLMKTETPAVIKVMVDATTMTDQEELDQTGNWSSPPNSSPPSNTKVTEYLTNLRQFLKVDQKVRYLHELLYLLTLRCSCDYHPILLMRYGERKLLVHLF